MARAGASGIAAFINGAFDGYEAKLRFKDAAEERKRRAEDDEWSKLQRKRQQDTWTQQDADRMEKLRLSRSNETWTEEQRDRTRSDWDREDEAHALEAGDKDTAAEAFKAAKKAMETDGENKRSRESKRAAGLGLLPPFDAAPTMLPGSSLDAAADSATATTPRPARPATRGMAPEPTTDMPLPALTTPRLADPETAAPQPQPVPQATPRSGGLMSLLNPVGAAAAAEMPADPMQEAIRLSTPADPGLAPDPMMTQAPAGPTRASARVFPDPGAAAPMAAPQAPAGLPGRAPAAAANSPRMARPATEGWMADRFGEGQMTDRAAPVQAAPQVSAAAPMPQIGSPVTPPRPATQGVGKVGGAMVSPSMPDSAFASGQPPAPGGATAAETPPSLAIAGATAPGETGKRAAAATGMGFLREPADGPEERVRDFMDYYQQESVPRIRDRYLATGRVAEADVFMKWARDEQAREGMEAWAKGVHAAGAGDEEGFLDHMIDAYNSNGYFDDGFQVDRKGSGFIKDKDGNVTGAKLTMKDQETGKTTTRTFENVEDIYRLGIEHLAPEKVFEFGMEQIQAADAARAEDAKHQRGIDMEVVKAALKNQPADRVAEISKSLTENDISGKFAADPAALEAAIVATIQAQDRAASALSRPQSRAVPAAPVQ